MALNNYDYDDILKSLRYSLLQVGLGGMDERIISELRGSEGPFYDLIYYLKLLIDEIALGADEQIKNVLGRVRNSVATESGNAVDGIEVQLSPEESKRYGTKKLIFGPDPGLQEIVSELQSLIKELKADHFSKKDPDRGLEL